MNKNTEIGQVYSTYVHKSRYARWIDAENRRETWPETVERYVTFFQEIIPKKDRKEVSEELREAILTMQVMPSMRALMTAGPALEETQVAAYNCSFIAVDNPRAFDEACYSSMAGVGVGFSVENQYISQMPVVAENFYPTNSIIKVKDSKIGWATALKELIQLLYGGMVPQWDLSAIRPKGAILKTFGGRASGPDPLEDLFKFVIATFKKAAGRKLNSIECHDIMCKIADIVVSGGVRRSAMLSLSDLSDDRMRSAKTGQWWNENVQRALANNSAVYAEKPDIGTFMREWLSLYESKSGERGIFNREAATIQAKNTERRKWEDVEYGGNPCGEIILRSMQHCNLTEVVIREDDSINSIKRKVRLAVILGTLQSTLTDFKYLRREWRKNDEEERLLGVSLTGIMDNPLTSQPSPELGKTLQKLREYAVEVNKEWAEKLGINTSAAITCVKPSGTVSQLVDCSPGIHTRWSKYYMKAVRSDRKDPIGALLKACGVPNEPDVTKPNDVDVFYFPLKSPENSVTKDERDAIQQLEMYLIYKQNWCEHNVSCFTEDTKFVTSQGIKTFSEFDDEDSVEILNAKGQWAPALVKAHGKQEIWEIVLERCGVPKVIRTTANHLWPLTYATQRHRKEKMRLFRTDELEKHQNKKMMTINPKFKIGLDEIAVLHGIVFGDGTVGNKHRKNHRGHVYLCNDLNGCDSRLLAPLFTKQGYKIVDRPEIGQIRIYGLPHTWKTLPDIESSTPEYLRGFVAGWFAADGHVGRGQVTLASVNPNDRLWLQKAAPKAGLAVSTSVGIVSIGITKETLDKEFFVLAPKQAKFKSAKHAKYWKIVSVKNTHKLEPVYCVEESVGQHFVLDGNVLTHNCTVTVKESEWLEVGAWVYEHFNDIGGVSFLPATEHSYRQPPLRELTKEEYDNAIKEFPEVDWNRLPEFETTNCTEIVPEPACAGGQCAI